MAQTDVVLNHMMEYGSITSIEAFEDYKITRISAVIFNLIHKDKIKIQMKREKFEIDGKVKTFGRYSLITPPSTAKA